MDDAVRLARQTAVARGDETGGLVLVGGRVLSVFTGGFNGSDFSVADGYVAGIGPGYRGTTRSTSRG